MKKIILFLAITGILIGCSKNDNKPTDVELVGTWKIIEVYADPGDGSGTYKPIENDKSITFNEDGTVTSNGSLCYLLGDGNPNSGTYSISDSKIISPDCNFDDFYTNFELSNSTLTIFYPCIEGCGEKYVKAN